MTTVKRELSASEIELDKFLESDEICEPDQNLLNKRKNALVLIQSCTDIPDHSRQSSPETESPQGQKIDCKTDEIIDQEIDEPLINRSITDDSAIVVGSESVPKSVSENPGSFTSRRINATQQMNRNVTTHSGG